MDNYKLKEAEILEMQNLDVSTITERTDGGVPH